MQRRKTSRRSQADLGEVGEKPPFGYLLAPPLLTDTTAVTGDSQWLLRLFTRDVHTWGTRVYPQLAQESRSPAGAVLLCPLRRAPSGPPAAAAETCT